jgi:hypothetical protein
LAYLFCPAGGSPLSGSSPPRHFCGAAAMQTVVIDRFATVAAALQPDELSALMYEYVSIHATPGLTNSANENALGDPVEHAARCQRQVTDQRGSETVH